MHRIILTLIIQCSLSQYGWSQTLTFDNTYGGGQNSVGIDFVILENGDYVLTGVTTSLGSSVYLSTVNSSGQEMWRKTPGKVGSNGLGIVRASDGGYVIAGTTTPNGSNYDYYLLKTNSLGDTVLTRTIGDSLSEQRTISFIGTLDGGYLLHGFSSKPRGVSLLKLNSDLDTLWTRIHNGWTGNDICQLNSGEYVMTGQTWSQEDSTAPDLLMVGLDTLGNIKWSRKYLENGYGAGLCIYSLPEGDILVGGTSSPFIACTTDVYISRMTSSGDTIWTKTYGGIKDDQAFDIAPTNDGGIIVAGRTRSFGAGTSDLWLLRCDADGDTIWTRTYGAEDLDWPNKVRQSPDGGFVVLGATYRVRGSSPVVWLLKTNEVGVVSVERTEFGKVPEFLSLAQNYPNPFNPSTRIQFVLNRDAFIRVSVVNMLGREVQLLAAQLMYSGSHEFEWSPAIPSGVYFGVVKASTVSEPRITSVRTMKMVLIK